MPNFTPHLQLEKPTPEDFYDVEVLNKNWDKIDEELPKRVPQTRTINKKPLSADVTLTGEDIKVTGSDETTIHTRLSEITNPNLLDNWYFANPVNQRGKISYTGTGYSIDRWKIIASPASLTLTDSGATLTRNDGNQWILNEQLDMTYLAELKGKHLSASALTTTCLVTLDVPSAFTSEVSVVDPSGVCLWVNVGGSVLVGTTGPDVTVIAVKLELGSQQTLAHLENGKWVLNEIPDYGEQLQRCQRYFRRFPANYMIGGFQNNTTAVFRYPCTPPMRTTPALVLQDASDLTNALDDGTSPLTPASVVLNWLSNPETIGFYFTGTTQNTCCLCNRYVDVSADL